MNPAQHWEGVYRRKRPTEVSWYRPHLDVSLNLVTVASTPASAIVDVGAGESTLIDDLLALGYRNLTAMDISSTALDVAAARLGEDARSVTWLCGDVRNFAFGGHAYDVWHDRAVFHFLTDPDDRAAYVQQCLRAVRTGGHVIVATFGPEGPSTCSGLPVARYSAETLHAEFGRSFQLVTHAAEEHQTPWGTPQQFTYCYCKIA